LNGKNLVHQPSFKPNGLMMCYIIETADDKLIVIDGGQKTETEQLYEYLGSLCASRGDGKIHVDMWLFTHAHDDHVDAAMGLFAAHRDVTVGRLYYNYPKAEDVAKYEKGCENTPTEFAAAYDDLASRMELVKFEEGMTFECGEAKFEVLYVPDYTITHNYVNNTSSVFRMTLSGKTFMFLGDLGVEGGRVMLNKHGSYLKSDYVQMAHHGQNGVDRPVYEAIAPSACLWDTPTWLWNNDAGNGWNSHFWKTVIVQGWMAELGVKKHYIAKDGPKSFEP